MKRTICSMLGALLLSAFIGACDGGSSAPPPPPDTTPPVITLLGDDPQVITAGTAYTELGATATDNVDGNITASIVIDASAVDTSTLGSYTVTYNVMDAAGNAATEVTRTVTVVPDTVPPVITLLGDNPQVILTGTAYTELGATATDNVDGDITASIVIDASAVDTSTPGSYTVTYNVMDAAGNAATEVTRTVNVVVPDTVPPVITLLGDNPQIITTGTAYTELGATATDDVDGDISGSIVIDSSAVDTSTAGSYSVTYDVSDSSGNAAVTVIRTVTVEDPPAQNPGGIWDGQSVTAASPDVFTSFEFNAVGPFTDPSWASPYTATFSSGNAETRGIPQFYITGANAWHILIGTSATVTFETLPNTLTFFARTVNAADVSNIDILDENGALILNVVPTNAFQPLNAPISVVRGAGQTLIGSVEVTSTSGGDVVIDDFTFGFAETTDDIACIVAETMEFACVIGTAPNFIASAQGTVQIANLNQVTGSGTLYAAPGFTLNDGSTFAALTISAGTVSEGNTLDFTVDVAGTTRTRTVSTFFDAIYNRGSNLATVAAVYTTFDIFGDMSSFTIDANGVITGNSVAGCVLNGQVTIIDAAFNAYDVALDVANCAGLNGMYDGLGLSDDAVVMDDSFAFAVFTAQTVIIGEAVK